MRLNRQVGALLALLLISFFSSSCAYYRFELRREKLADSDVIIVPGMELDQDGRGNWILWNRMLMARKLYEEGRGDKILVTGGVPKAGVTEAAKMLEFGARLGIPREAMLVEDKASSSVENGRFSAEILLESEYSSGLFVSDRAHLAYAIPVIRDAFRERGLALHWVPVDYERLSVSSEFCPPGGSPEAAAAGFAALP